jgi:hypothetical protein
MDGDDKREVFVEGSRGATANIRVGMDGKHRKRKSPSTNRQASHEAAEAPVAAKQLEDGGVAGIKTLYKKSIDRDSQLAVGGF